MMGRDIKNMAMIIIDEPVVFYSNGSNRALHETMLRRLCEGKGKGKATHVRRSTPEMRFSWHISFSRADKPYAVTLGT